MPRKIIKSKHFFEQDFVESIAEVPQEEYKPLPSNDKLKYIGKEINRKDGYDKVSGTAKYTFDIKLPRMVYARTLRCPFPHAKIKNIDTSKADKLEGVLHIISYKNTPEIRWYGDDMSFLFDTHLRYQGDEVACVAAISDEIAEEAIKLIKVEYEELPFVVNATDAMKSDAPELYDSGNLMNDNFTNQVRGDVEKGFEEADVIFEDTYTTPVVVHNPTEVHCSVVNWDGEKLTVYDSTQAVFSVRDTVAGKLGIDANSVRVIKEYMGGGFGAKLTAGKYTVMAALLAKKLGRPIKITLDRKEMNLAVGNRPDSFQKIKIGAKKDGTLTAMYLRNYGSSGAYPSWAGVSWPFRALYKCPNNKVEENSVYINAGPGRPFRAPGFPQGIFALDSILDDVAEKIEMDPLDFRIKNFTEMNPVNNNPYTSKKLIEAYKKGAESFGWYEKRRPAGSDKGRYKTGFGMASQLWWGGGGPPAYATLKLNRDGSATVISGTQDIGTGTYTFIAQVAAEILEIPVDKIDVIVGDTEVAPYGPGSGGSTTAPSISPAVRDAAEQMKAKLISSAAAIWEVDENDIEYKNSELINLKDNSKKLSIGEIYRKIGERVLVTTGARGKNLDGYDINSFGVQFAEVEVDTLTGKVQVKKIVSAYDIGRVLNKKTMENQVHGGIMQGIGYALMEERVIDRNTGKVLTTDLHNYKMPTVSDTPEIEVHIVSEGDEKISNTGVKGVGEPAIIPTAGAIANAVYNAIGVRIKSLPITPDKIINALYQ